MKDYNKDEIKKAKVRLLLETLNIAWLTKEDVWISNKIMTLAGYDILYDVKCNDSHMIFQLEIVNEFDKENKTGIYWNGNFESVIKITQEELFVYLSNLLDIKQIFKLVAQKLFDTLDNY